MEIREQKRVEKTRIERRYALLKVDRRAQANLAQLQMMDEDPVASTMQAPGRAGSLEVHSHSYQPLFIRTPLPLRVQGAALSQVLTPRGRFLRERNAIGA